MTTDKRLAGIQFIFLCYQPPNHPGRCSPTGLHQELEGRRGTCHGERGAEPDPRRRSGASVCDRKNEIPDTSGPPTQGG